VAKLKKLNLTGQSIGEVDVDARLANAEANGQMIKDYITAIRANARQWSASTKTRSEVAHTTRKPRPQKGSGNARQGSLVGTQFRGGGRPFGPRPKFDQHVRINKKERQAAIRCLIAEKIRENRLHIIPDTEIGQPKTKTIADFLKKSGINGRVLFLGESNYKDLEMSDGENQFSLRIQVRCDKHENFVKSLRNLPRVEFMLASNISGYDVVVAKDIILTEAALDELTQWLT